jgi:hypothetical protein
VDGIGNIMIPAEMQQSPISHPVGTWFLKVIRNKEIILEGYVSGKSLTLR